MKLSAAERRTIAIAAAVLIPSLGFVWVVRPYSRAVDDTRDQVMTERDALAREQSAIEAARRNPAAQRSADSASRVMTPRLFSGRDAVMTTAELASYLGDQAQRSRLWLQEASTRPATFADGVRTLRVDVRGESDLRGVLRFLDALERGSKLVRVERLDIARSPRADDEQSETLTIAATIAGFSLAADSAVSGLPAPKAAVAQRDVP